jgi:hypothetical protein
MSYAYFIKLQDLCSGIEILSLKKLLENHNSTF